MPRLCHTAMMLRAQTCWRLHALSTKTCQRVHTILCGTTTITRLRSNPLRVKSEFILCTTLMTAFVEMHATQLEQSSLCGFLLAPKSRRAVRNPSGRAWFGSLLAHKRQKAVLQNSL